MTLKRTTERLPTKRYGADHRVTFDRGERVKAFDSETEEWAAETFDELELVGADADAQSSEETVEDEAARAVTEMDEEDADREDTE